MGGTLARLLDKHGEGVLTAAGVTDEAFLNGESLSQPDNMLGEHNPDKSYRYKHIDGAMDEAALTRLAARDLPAPAGPRTPDDLAAAVEGTVTPDDIDSARAYALTRDYPIPEGTISQDGRYILRGSRWHRLDEGDPALSTSRGLAEDLQRFMRLRNDDPVAAEAQRQALAQRVQAFMDEYGDPNEHDRITERAKDVHGLAHLLAAVEGGTLAGHLTQPVRAPQGLDDTNPHAVAAHLHRSGRLTPETLARRWAKDGRDEATTEEARAFLMQHYAVDENGAWMPEPAFYQGNVPEKEAMLQRAAASARAAGDEELAGQYDRQRERLRELLPRKSIEDFDVTPRSPWIPANAVEAFIEQVLDEGSDYTVTTDRGVVYVQRHGYGVLPREVEEFQRYLNHATRVDAVRDQKSKSKSAIQAERKANIERAKLAEERFQRQFRAWVGDSDYREAVEGAYNERINNWLEPDYASTPIHIPGWNPDLKLHSWQHAYVAKAATMGSSLNAHDVGLGKTFAGIALLAKLRREGQAKKPMIVCPKSLIPNWVKNSAFATPDDNVLVVGQTETGKDEDGKPIFRDDTEKDVARKLVQIATGDWDKVIISKNWFATIPIKDENVDRLTMTDPEMMRMDELRSDDEEGREAYKGQARRKRGKSARDIVKDREKAQQKVRKRMFKHMVNPLHWEDLGVDALMVDEAHMYKNLYAAPSTFGQQPKFMGGSAESKQAMDFLFKSRLLRERTGGSGIHLLTATPTKNSPLEVFNMLRHVAPAFDEVAPTVDAFVSRYANIGTAFTPDAKGDLTTTPAVVGFQNLTELRNLMGRWVDRKTADDVGLELPERDDHEAYFDLHPDVQPMYQRLAEEAKDAAGKRDAEGEDHLFAKFAQMQKLTLDPALIDPSLGNLPNPRYERAAEVARNALSEDGKVVMFMDFGQAEADTDPEDLDDDVESLDAYDRLLKHLADAGVPRDQIAVATAKTLKDTAARGEIESRFEKGDLRVVIGSTGVIGEGFNLQAGTTDMVHLNTPWDPGTYWQRLGRAVRQGNPVEKVRNHVMLAKGSFDGLTYSTMLGKRGWMDHLWNSDTDQASNETGANQYEEIVSMLSADPDQAREFMRKKKEEMNQQAEQAMRVASLRSLGEYGRKRAAHTGATQRLQSAETRLQDAQEKLQQEVDPDRAQKLRERVTHLEKQTETYQQRRDTLEQQMRSASTTLAQDENLPTEFTPLLDDPDRPFVVDNKGGVYTPGSVFQLPRRDGSMDIARVENVDHVKQTVTVSPAIPSPHASSRARTIDLADLARSSGHALELSDDVYGQAAVQRASMGPQGLKDVSPERVAKHADEIQEALQKHGPSRAYVVTRDGNVEYRQADRAFNSVELGEDERFLLNTTEDRDRFTRTFPNGVDAPMGLPFAVRHKMFDDPDSPYGRTYRMALEENPEYLIKATPPPPPRPHARLRIRGGTLPRMFAKAPATGYPLQGRRKWRGLDVSIEHRRGSTRSGTDPDGNDWSTTMTHDYGYLRGTEGTDGDHLDVFMGDAKAARKVYVIHILRPDTGEYDEDKVMLDFSSADAARHAFDRNYDRPTRFYGGMTEWPADEFARLCRDGKLKGRVVMGQPRKTARRPELERLLDIARGGRTVRATLRGGR